MKIKRFIGIFLALCLAVGMAFAAGVPASAANEVTVTLFSQVDNAGFILSPQEAAVSADLSDTYGYEDSVTGDVSMLDALIAAHILVFGADKAVVNTKFEFVMGGVKTMMGVTTTNAGYFLNGATMGSATADQLAIADGDVVSLHVYKNSYGADALAWFEADGGKVEALSVMAGDSVEITLCGLPGAGWGEDADMFWGMMGLDGEGPVDNAEIVPVTLSGAGATFGASIATTNTDGKATITFNTPGEVILSAIALEDEDWCDMFGGPGWADNSMYVVLLSPWLKVTVKTEAMLLDEAKQARIAAINAVDDSLNAANYSPESWAALQSAIANAIAAVNAAASIADVNSVALPATSGLAAYEPTTLEKWQAKLPDWLSGVPALPDWFEWVIMIVFFGWIWWLF